jgi:peptide subunit release factor 1 (eRF1)
VVDELENLFYERPFRGLLVGGTEEVVAEFVKMLPTPLEERFIGRFPVNFKHETEAEIIQSAIQEWEEHERQVERERVKRLIEEAQADGKAVLGFEKTIRALLEGRVQELVVADGLTRDGSLCRNCGFLTAAEIERCPACGAQTELWDVVEQSVLRAYLTRSSIETVQGEAQEWLLSQGGIGALLRY